MMRGLRRLSSRAPALLSENVRFTPSTTSSSRQSSGNVAGCGVGATYSLENAHSISRLASSMRLKLAPGKVIDTFTFSGAVPGPVLRVRGGQKADIDVTKQ